MKHLIILSSLVGLLASCGTFRKTQNSGPQTRANTQPRFLENISIDQESTTASQRNAAFKAKTAAPEVTSAAPDIEKSSSLQFKYAILMDVAVEELTSGQVLPFIDEWYGTPYRLGGNSKSGIDCSAFSLLFASSIYGLSLPRTSREQKEVTLGIEKSELREGDLVFFSTRKGRPVSHVGIYLRNNKFVHASTSSGVMISDLGEAYWGPRYVGAGRIKELNTN